MRRWESAPRGRRVDVHRGHAAQRVCMLCQVMVPKDYATPKLPKKHYAHGHARCLRLRKDAHARTCRHHWPWPLAAGPAAIRLLSGPHTSKCRSEYRTFRACVHVAGRECRMYAVRVVLHACRTPRSPSGACRAPAVCAACTACMAHAAACTSAPAVVLHHVDAPPHKHINKPAKRRACALRALRRTPARPPYA